VSLLALLQQEHILLLTYGTHANEAGRIRGRHHGGAYNVTVHPEKGIFASETVTGCGPAKITSQE